MKIKWGNLTYMFVTGAFMSILFLLTGGDHSDLMSGFVYGFAVGGFIRAGIL